MKDKGGRPWLSVIVGGESLVSHAGATLLVETARRSGLTKPVLPTSAPFWLDRLVNAGALTAGVGFVVLAVVDLARELSGRSPQPQPAL